MTNVKGKRGQEPPDLWQIAFDDERRVVGACLLFPPQMSECRFLAPTHFTNSDCRTVWSVMAEFYKQGGSWDLASVASDLAHRGAPEPESMLARLTEGVLASNAIERAAVKVRQMSLRCRLLKELENLRQSLMDPVNDLDQNLRSTRRAMERFAAESENSQPDLALNCPLLAKSPEPPCQVLDEIAAFIQKFVILNASEVQVISLWIAHTIHTVPSHVQVSPLRLKLSSRPPNNST